MNFIHSLVLSKCGTPLKNINSIIVLTEVKNNNAKIGTFVSL
jgi:hypothetical protein